MEPTFRNGSIIYLVQECDINYNGEIAAVQVNDVIPACFLKKVYIDRDKSIVRLISINSHYEDIVLPIDSIKILGKVIYPFF